ncbi:MAG: type II and III secretion system protein [Bdellovibrionota bacterium]
MTNIIWFFLWLNFSHPTFAADTLALKTGIVTPGGSQIQVPVGQSYKIPFPVRKAWIRDRELIQAEEKKGFLWLTPLKKGETLIRLDERDFTFQALGNDSLKFWKSFRGKTTWIGLDTKFKGGELTFTGNLHLKTFYDDIVKRAAKHNTSFVLEVSMDDQLKKYILERIQNSLKKSGLQDPGINITEPFVLTLNPNHPHISDYQNILGALGVRVVSQARAFSEKSVVRTKITILEVQKNISQKWGVLWEGKYKAALSPVARLQDNLDVEIQALENSGQAKVLASPSLLCLSGSEAEFLAGGEFPIKTSGYRQEGLTWKRFGVYLKVRPLVDAGQRIQLALETEISQVSGIVENLPTMSTNKVISHFEVSNGRTIVLSGLIQNSTWKSDQGIIGLKDIPILGALFKSTDFQERKTELVILVKPEIENDSDPVTNETSALNSLREMEILKDKLK